MLLRNVVISILLADFAYCLWPQPHSITTGTSTLLLSPQFTISGLSNPPQDVTDAISRTTSLLSSDQLERLVVGRGSSDSSALASAKQLTSLKLAFTGSGSVKSISQEAIADPTTRNEAYSLTVPADGSAATLTFNSSLGLLRGLTTFGQLWYEFDGTTYAVGMPVAIQDQPAFPYRGFMLDTARNFFPVAAIKRTIDAMSMVKINTLHWHVVDAQSFPIQVPAFPEVATKGAYSSKLSYSAADVQDIVSYAAARGVDVLAEFDTPGHTAVIAESHPEHVACPTTTQDYNSNFANEPPQGQLRFAVPATQNFTLSLLRSFSSMFSSTLFSTGGDEINLACYTQDQQTQAALKAAGQTFEQSLSTFTLNMHQVLLDAGKSPVVWQEMVLDHNTNVKLSNKTIAMVWESSADAASVAQKGYRLIHAPSDYFYLDCGAGEWLNSVGGANSWCDPFKNWQKAYSFDPFANLTSAQTHLVLGGEQLLWTEQSGPENLDSIVWPRAAVSAEIFWTGAPAAQRSVKDALPRLHDVRYRMVQRGINAINLQPLWCALRPGQCDL